MHKRLALLFGAVVAGLSAGSATAYATSCAWPALDVDLAPVAVTVDGEPAEPGSEELRILVGHSPPGPAQIVLDDDGSAETRLDLELVSP